MNSIKKIKIPSELSKLARVFPVDLYIVGGYVRNQILGIDQGDIDLCSSLSVNSLAKIVDACGFSVKYMNKQLGTAKLVYEDKVYDYATFRTERYGDDKNHKPCHIEFIDSIEEDAKRRDFTINAIYYNINKESITDFFNGTQDLRKGIVRAIGVPDDVMQNDGERIIRMIRFSAEFRFKIDKATLASAYRNLENLNGINPERIMYEIYKILYCDSRYDIKYRKSYLKNSLKLLNRMCVWKYIGLEVDRVNYNMVRRVKEKALGLLIDMVDTVNPASVSYFLFKVLKPVQIAQKKINQIVNIVSGYYDALNKKSNKQYFFKYFDNFEAIHALLAEKNKIIAQKYHFFYKYIISHHLVITQKDLKVNSKDLKERFPSIPVKNHAEILEEVLSDVFDGMYPNEKEIILDEIENKMTLRKK